MSEIDLEKLLNEPIYASDFQFMISDVRGFLEFSENNIDWQFQRERQSIQLRADAGDFNGFPEGYQEHLETNEEHRFRVSLPLRVRYAAVLVLTTSVEWSTAYLVERLTTPLDARPSDKNATVHALRELDQRFGQCRADTVADYEALVRVRNCITHNAGLARGCKFQNKLHDAIDRLDGFSLGNWHIFGAHVCIERDALNPYIDRISELVLRFHKTAYEKGLLKKG